MFKKFKDKLAEEMKQSPARLQASMQQLAQAVVSPALSNSSVQELSTSNDNFSLTEEGDDTPKNSPAKHGFQDVDLTSPVPNSVGISRRSSISSITSDSSSLFPIYESPANVYHLQSDMDQSASEVDENISLQLDKVSKDQIYSAYRKVQAKYHKYRGRYSDLATHYKELERVKGKLESVLVETQDKVLRRIADLKEQCQLEQQAKAHLEEALRNDIEEKEHIINTLNTKIKLLQTSGPNVESTLPHTDNDQKDNLIDFNSESVNILNESALVNENLQLKDKLKKLENVVFKYKESLKRNKEKFTEVFTEKNALESELKSLQNSYTEKDTQLDNAYVEIKNLKEQMMIIKKQEEESVISLAENKLSIHRELEHKEEQIKKLQQDLQHVTDSRENLNKVANKYKAELEKFKLLSVAQSTDLEKKGIQDTSKEKLQSLNCMQQEVQQKFSEEKIESKNEKEVKAEEEISMENKIAELQKLVRQYEVDKENLCAEITKVKLKYIEQQSEQDAQKIVTEEKRKEAEIAIEKLQATIQSLDKELENMRNALIDRDRVCETYNVKVQEYAKILEENKEISLEQGREMKVLNEKLQVRETNINKLQKEVDEKNAELIKLRKEIQFCKSFSSDLENKLQANNSNIEKLSNDRNGVIKRVLQYRDHAEKLKEDYAYIKHNLMKHSMEFNDDVSFLKNTFDTFIKSQSNKPDSKNELHEFEELEQKYNELRIELQESLENKSKLENDLKNCNKQLNEMSVELNKRVDVDTKNRKLIAEIDNLNFKLYDLRNISNEMESLKKNTEIMLKEQNDSKKSQDLEEEIITLKSDMKLLEENLQEKSEELENLTQTLENKTKHLNELIEKNEYNTNLVTEYEVKIKKLANLNKQLKNDLNANALITKCLRAFNRTKRSMIQKLNNEANKMKELNAMRSIMIQTLKKESDTLKSENQRIVLLETDNSTITSELEQLKLIQNEISLENKQLKNKQNEFLKHNQDLNETNEKLKKKVMDYEQHNQKLISENNKLNRDVELCKSRLNEQEKDIDNFKSQLTLLNTELESSSKKLNNQIEELISDKESLKEIRERLTKENLELQNELDKLRYVLNKNKELHEQNEKLSSNLKSLNEEISRLRVAEEQVNNLRLQVDNLNDSKVNVEKMQSLNTELMEERLELKNKITELENINLMNMELQSHVNNLESKVSNLEKIEVQNNELKVELDILKNLNVDITSQLKHENAEKEKLITESNELRHMLDEKVEELILLDKRNMELLKEIERLKDLTTEREAEMEKNRSNDIKYLKDTIVKLQEEIEILKKSNGTLQEEIQTVNSRSGESLIKCSDRLQEEKKKLEAQLDEALITFQAKELQMQLAKDDLKNEADKLKEELKTNEEEQSMRLKQLVKEFQAQLQEKDEELHAALEKRFDCQQNYESNLIQQYKEQLKDFQVELTMKSEQIENLILENKSLMAQKAKDINQLMEKMAAMKKEHMDEIREIEKKWKSIMQQKTDQLEAKHEEEVSELTREWRNERRPDEQIDLVNKELESTSQVAMAAVQSNTGSFHTLQQTLTAQRRELNELRKLVRITRDTLEDSTEIEYLRNILFEYMMGRETMVLARVIAAVVKFNQEQTAKILKKEEEKMTLLGSLGLT